MHQVKKAISPSHHHPHCSYTIRVDQNSNGTFIATFTDNHHNNNNNNANNNNTHRTTEKYDDVGALYYVIAVIFIYGCSIFMMIASYIRKNKEDRHLKRYLKEMAFVRKRETQMSLVTATAKAAEFKRNALRGLRQQATPLVGLQDAVEKEVGGGCVSSLPSCSSDVFVRNHRPADKRRAAWARRRQSSVTWSLSGDSHMSNKSRPPAPVWCQISELNKRPTSLSISSRSSSGRARRLAVPGLAPIGQEEPVAIIFTPKKTLPVVTTVFGYSNSIQDALEVVTAL